MLGDGGMSTRGMFVDRLQLDLPQYSRDQLMRHEGFVDDMQHVGRQWRCAHAYRQPAR